MEIGLPKKRDCLGSPFFCLLLPSLALSALLQDDKSCHPTNEG